MAPNPGQYVRNFIFLTGVLVLAALSAVAPARAAPYAAYVMDVRTGETLYSENADTRLHPASLTKMMTLYITFQEIERGNISLDTMVTVTKNAASQPPSRLGLKAGQKIAVRYLIRAAAVKSANDAAQALGDFIGGDQAGFAARMNRTAQSLGMRNSSFRNANGLTAPGHLSTAHDMSILGRRLFYDFPQYYNIFSRRTADAGMAQVANTNTRFLEAYKGADGIKTGYTVAAGFNLVASAERGNKRIIATVFGGKSTAHRNQKVAELMDIGFGKAPNNARTKVPTPPAYQGNDVIAAQDEALPETQGGAGKTIRVAMAMQKSRRPQARPDAGHIAATADAVAAMQSDIEGALAEAIAPVSAPAPEPEPGTLDAQVATLAAAPAPRPQARPAAPAPAVIATAAADATELAAIDEGEVFRAPEEGSIVALSAPAPTPAAAAPLPFGTADATTEALASGEPVEMAALAAPKRNAPNFEGARAKPKAKGDQGEVVTRVSTSGGRHYGINVGRFNTRSGAESALTKTLLAESATLNGALRKVVAGNRGYEANFMGLTQDQAELACARLQARGTQCFSIGQ